VETPEFSLVVPVYNEAENLYALYDRLRAIVDRLGPTELIFIDDGSRDRSLAILRALRDRDPRLCYLSFARNFGHQTAVTAGLNFARGRAIVVMDADLQDPPELLPELADRWRQGYEVVYARRTKRRAESRFKRWSAHLFYRLLQRLADVNIPADTGDFCLMDRRVVEVLNRMPERHRYIRGLRAWVGFRQTSVEFERDPRHAGTVKYTFRKSLGLAIDSLVSFSIVPLRLSTYLGLTASLVSLLMACLVLYWRLYQPDSPVTGLAAIVITILFIGSVQLVCIGILGEYIGRIYDEVKGRPLYAIAETAGFERAESGRSPAA